jgi:hypothetical protein
MKTLSLHNVIPYGRQVNKEDIEKTADTEITRVEKEVIKSEAIRKIADEELQKAESMRGTIYNEILERITKEEEAKIDRVIIAKEVKEKIIKEEEAKFTEIERKKIAFEIKKDIEAKIKAESGGK